MAGRNVTEYEALLQELEEAWQGQRRAEEQQRQAEEQQRYAEEQQRQAEEEREQGRELTRETTFDEYMAACHSLLCEPLRVACPSRSTRGNIPAPTGKYCPTRFHEWGDFDAQQTEAYSTVRSYLQSDKADAPRLFSPLLALRDLGRRLCS
jgi:type II secretory pathway pseudopilin PulG